MSHWKGVRGRLRVRLISADQDGAMNAILQSGIEVRRVYRRDSLTADFTVDRASLLQLNQLVQRRGDRVELVGREGAYWGLRRLVRRPVLISGILLIVLLTLFTPMRVLFIQVEGNDTVPTNLILEAAQRCGIYFGANARQIRSEKMKNALLHQIPQLQWAGINTNGCVAVISVREKTVVATNDTAYPISSLVARQDGYITQMTVTAGSAVCKQGQSVKAGQMLISAYTDCGLHIQAVKARGEVYADTQRQLEAVTFAKQQKKTKFGETQKQFSLLLGKKQIFFSKGSGISVAQCDRIRMEYYMTLPGGFHLPIALVVDSLASYDLEDVSVAQSDGHSLLTAFSSAYLDERMIAGTVLASSEEIFADGEIYVLSGQYQCNEMICVPRTEEILKQNE